MGRVSMDVPPQLRSRSQWVTWKYIGDDRRKVPYQINGLPAKSNDPETWTTFDYASKSVNSLGFVFAPDDGLFGIDLDGCISADGELQAWAQEIVDRFDTYAEVSPSGHGVKIWGLGAMPGGSGKKTSVDAPKCCDKQPAIEAYDRGRYFTFTGERLPTAPLEVVECQAALDWLVAKYWPPKMVPVQPSPVLVTSYDAKERARKYLAAMGPCDPRPEHPMDASTHLLRAFGVMVGFGLEDGTALELVREWDMANPCGPYSEKEYQRKLTDAKKHWQPGCLLTEQFTSGPAVDITEVMAQGKVESATKPAKSSIGMLPAGLLKPPGLIADVVEWTLACSMYPQPELALAGALSLMATITGRKVRDHADTRTNIYVIGLCPSGAGKEQARKTNKTILYSAGGVAMIGPEDIASSAGLITTLDKSPACLLQLDEIGRTIGYTQNPMAQHMQKVAGYLLKLYSSANSIMIGDAYADSKKTKTLYSPHCVVYGTSVPGKFWGSLTTENVGEGLVGRMLVFDSFQGVDVLPRDPENPELPASIVERVKWWIEYAPGKGNAVTKDNPVPQMLVYDDAARERFASHRLEIAKRRRDDENSEVSTLWSRTAEKTAKLALIFACSRAECEPPKSIELQDVDRAIALSNWITRMMAAKVESHVSESKYEAFLKKVLRAIGTGCTQSELTRRTQWLDRKTREAILSDLRDCGRIELTAVETATRPAIRITVC